jgi:hypothetical protein
MRVLIKVTMMCLRRQVTCGSPVLRVTSVTHCLACSMRRRQECTDGLVQAGEDGEWDGVVDRDYIKHRTAKLLAAKRSADAKGAAAKVAA